MKLPVVQYLNARTGQPSTEATVVYYRSPGETLELDDIVSGTPINGNALWYHCSSDGCYYWSGGMAITDQLLERPAGQPGYSRETKLAIYRSAASELGLSFNDVPGYRGIGVGYKTSGEVLSNSLSLIFYVDRKIEQGKIPPRLRYRGFELVTDVQTIGRIVFQAGAGDGDGVIIEADAGQPYQMGGSISEITIPDRPDEYGTRTMLVTKGSKDYLLTCFHVACQSLFARDVKKLTTEQIMVSVPSPHRSAVDDIFQLPVTEACFGSNYEYALIDIKNCPLIASIPPLADFSGVYTKKELEKSFLDNQTLLLYGAASETSQNEYISFDSEVHVIEEDKPHFTLSGLITARPMSQGGDSGAPVVDSNNKLIGFVIGADEHSLNTYIVPFATLAESSLSIQLKLPPTI
ncbi:MAG: hypothetical protein JST39_05590 [Bacteroidetes bacterium]|nr:hypothetical protein [Bacteroidota bacterium]